ncbi:MAG TPA: winged helix-turn-helix domain-containing protein [Solirubrobacterales bacterium]|nr:winged helix-turn-helix domain-containing protein [Solirubrobacterales bacterium]
MNDPRDLSAEIDWERLARAETHLLRISILELLAIDGGRALSPKEMAHELQASLGNVNYHVRELCESQLIRLVYEHEVGGTIEHFYCLPDHSAADLYERLKP